MRIEAGHTIDIGIITHYNDIPFTGVIFELYETGELSKENDFINGLKHGKTVWYYKSGVVKEEQSYVNDVREGLLKAFHENGVLSFEVNVVNGIQEGLNKEYYENGNLQLEGDYIDGKREGLWKGYDLEGNYNKEVWYENDELDRVEKVDSVEEYKGLTAFNKTTLVTKTHTINWVNVKSKDSTGSVKSSPFVAYDGDELLSKDFQLKNSVNVPAWFEDEDGDVYLLIKSNTEADAKTLINRIINDNGGMDKFTEVFPGGGWLHTFRADEFVIGYMEQHEVVRLNKIRPQPPEVIKVESEEDNTIELPDTINEIIQLIESNPQVKIKIESSEWIDGSFQLSDDVESDSIEISDDEDGYDDFNVRKQKYSGSYYTWAQGIIENDSFLKYLNEFIKDEDIDPDEADIYDFCQYCQDYEVYTQDPESIKEHFAVKEYSDGAGRSFGLNELSWYSVDYTRDSEVEIKLLA